MVAEQLHKHKDFLSLILENWCAQLLSLSPANKIDLLKAIETFFQSKQYNLNLKLALESLLIKLSDNVQST